MIDLKNIDAIVMSYKAGERKLSKNILFEHLLELSSWYTRFISDS